MDVSYKKSCMAFGVGAVFIFAVVVCLKNDDVFQGEYLSSRKVGFSKVASYRRLLVSLSPSPADRLDRVSSSECSKEEIYVSQGQTSPLPNGIPTYTVQIQNICMPSGSGSGSATESCSISDIHLSCGWFSSARLINPFVFKRISYNDCLVNNGDPLHPGQTISFQYANTYPYPMSVSSLSCY